jgi:hypothetical protein
MKPTVLVLILLITLLVFGIFYLEEFSYFNFRLLEYSNSDNVMTSTNENIITNVASLPIYNNIPILVIPKIIGIGYSSCACVNSPRRAPSTFKVPIVSTIQCVFRNVEYTRQGKIIYYQNPADVNDPDFPLTLKVLQFYDMILIQAKMNITNNSRIISLPNGVCHIFTHHEKLALQPGHTFDFIWATFAHMMNLGMLSLQNIIVLIDYEKSHSKMWETLSSKIIFSKSLFPHLNDSSIVLGCAMKAPKDLGHEVVRWPSVRIFSSGYHMRLFRDRALALLGLQNQPNILSQYPRIGIRYKDKRHSILNQYELEKHLAVEFPGSSVSIYQPEKMSCKDEINFTNSLDVYISPWGGGALTSWALPDGATAILSDLCCPQNLTSPIEGNSLSCTLAIESYIWETHMHYLKKYISSKNLSELVYQGTQILSNRSPMSCLSFSFPFHFDVVDPLVKNALFNRKWKIGNSGLWENE